jgi:hypothetical protein
MRPYFDASELPSFRTLSDDTRPYRGLHHNCTLSPQPSRPTNPQRQTQRIDSATSTPVLRPIDSRETVNDRYISLVTSARQLKAAAATLKATEEISSAKFMYSNSSDVARQGRPYTYSSFHPPSFSFYLQIYLHTISRLLLQQRDRNARSRISPLQNTFPPSTSMPRFRL